MKRHVSSSLTIIVAILLSLVISCGNNNDHNNKEMVKLSTRIKWFPYSSYIGTFVADDWGFFKKKGLDVTIYNGGPQVDATKLVAAGDNDFGICGGDQLIVARSKGLPLVAIAALMQESPAAFMVHADSDIYSFKDFIGKRMRVIPGHNTYIEYQAVMSKEGLDRSQVKEVVNFTELQLFLANEIDIEPIYLNNQTATARHQNVEFRVIKPSDHDVHVYGNVYFTTEEMIKNNPETVQNFLEAVMMGWKGAFEDPEKAVDSLLKYSDLLIKEVELDKLRSTKPLMHRDDQKIGWMEEQRWTQISDILLMTKVIDRPVDPKLAFDNSFIENIYR